MVGGARAAGLRVCVTNLGCRVNRVESDWMERAFLDEGCALVPEDEADVVAVNTCAVTGEAQAKTRHAVRHALSLPNVRLVAVTGCVANLFPDELAALGERVCVLPAKLALAHDVARICRERGIAPAAGAAAWPVRTEAAEVAGEPAAFGSDDAGAPAPSGLARLRRGVKVQDGCDNRCTYCIVWRARGASASVPLDDVRAQVRRVLAEGAREVALTGVNLGRYEAAGAGFPELLRAVCELARPAGAQLRASSMEPPEATPEVARAFAELADVACPHLHLPVQSGCSETLARMGRTYDAEGFMRIVDGIRAHLPHAALSTDVIVGFPGETDAEFEQSLALCRRVGFAKMHVFRFSARPDTPAASMGGQVEPRVMQERSERLRELAGQMRAADARSRVGTEERVLVERVDASGVGHGSTESYQRVLVEAAAGVALEPGLVRARLTGLIDAPATTLRATLTDVICARP